MYFQNYGLRKTLLNIGLKSPVSGDPRTGNMLKRPKHCCNMDDRTVIIFSDHFGDK